MRKHFRVSAVGAAAIAAALSLAACGSSSSTSSSTSTSTGSTASSGGSTSSSGQAAAAAVAPFLQTPTTINLTTPATQSPPQGLTVGLRDGNLQSAQELTAR